MRVIISPAKKMIVDDSIEYRNLPAFIDKAEELKNYLSSLTYEELKKIWKCNDKIALENFERINKMDLRRGLTPAVLSYTGIQYTYMAPSVFSYDEFEYIENTLRILSGFYGILRPFDGVAPYRLEMQAKIGLSGYKDLYDFWGRSLAEELLKETDVVVNLASKEYSKCVYNYIKGRAQFITCVFGEQIDGRIVEKGTMCKMARGEMVRFMAQNNIASLEEIKKFSVGGYVFWSQMSDSENYVFIKNKI